MADTVTPERPSERNDAAETPGGPAPGTGGRDARAATDLNLIRTGATVLAVLGVVALLHFAASVFITLFSALLLAFALEPVVHLLCVRTRLRRQHASGIVVFLFVAMIYGVFSLAYIGAETFLKDLPTIAAKIRSAPAVENLSKRFEEADRLVSEAGRGISPKTAPGSARTAPPVVVREGDSFTGSLLRGLGSLGNAIFFLSFVPFLVYFMLADREPLTRRTREMFPREYRETVGEILVDIERVMRKFLVGNGVVAGILSVATILVFLAVGLPYPVALGILSGVLSTVPYLGLVLALLPGLVVALVTIDAPHQIVVLVTTVTVFHLVAINYLVPRFVGGGVHLNATSSTAALLFFGWLWGGMGLILGIPILAVLKCVLDNVPSTRRIGIWLGD
ncbi:MAG TPA: AI-2E family transporter [Candidatus Deferrimicrobiaceae bacterium]